MRAFPLRRLLGAEVTIWLLLIWAAMELVLSLAISGHNNFFHAYGLSRHGMGLLQLWQPVTYGLIHNGTFHMMMNGLLLLVVGWRLEWLLGRTQYLLLLCGGMLLGGLMHLVFSPNVLVGGSGIVFACLLCTMTLSPESRWLVPFPVSGKNLGRGLLSASLILMVINPVLALPGIHMSGIPGLSSIGQALVDAGFGSLFQISHTCHFGGAAAGWLMARWVLRNRVSLADLQRDRARREEQ